MSEEHPTFRYSVQLELNIKTKRDMASLTATIYRVVEGLMPRYGHRVPIEPDFISAEIEQITVKQLRSEEVE